MVKKVLVVALAAVLMMGCGNDTRPANVEEVSQVEVDSAESKTADSSKESEAPTYDELAEQRGFTGNDEEQIEAGEKDGVMVDTDFGAIPDEEMLSDILDQVGEDIKNYDIEQDLTKWNWEYRVDLKEYHGDLYIYGKASYLVVYNPETKVATIEEIPLPKVEVKE